MNLKHEAGTEVLVMNLDFDPIGFGHLLYGYDPDDDDDAPMPEIAMPDGDILLGCDCWWMATSELSEASLTKLRNSLTN